MKRSIIALLSLVAAALLASSATIAADPGYAAPGSFTFRVIDASWRDSARQRDLPLRLRLPETASPTPVILFSHGLGGSRRGGAEWAEHWASHGFAVITVQHSGSDEALWKDKPPGERLAALRSGASIAEFLARIADVKFVVGELSRRQQAGEPEVARLDLDRIGMSGHSFGAVTTLFLGGQRPPASVVGPISPPAGFLAERRLRAFVALSPQAAGSDLERQFASFTRPALLVTGTLDGQPFPGIGASPSQRLLLFEAMPAAGNKFLLVVDKADHMFFNGSRGLRDFGTSGREAVDFDAVEARGYRKVKSVSTAYWAAFLRDDDAAARWLKDGDASAAATGGDYFKAK